MASSRASPSPIGTGIFFCFFRGTTCMGLRGLGSLSFRDNLTMAGVVQFHAKLFYFILEKIHTPRQTREANFYQEELFCFVPVNFCLLFYCLSSTYFFLGRPPFQSFIQWPLVIALYFLRLRKQDSKNIFNKLRNLRNKSFRSLLLVCVYPLLHVGNKIFRSNRDNLLWNHINNVQTDKLIKPRPRQSFKAWIISIW